MRTTAIASKSCQLRVHEAVICNQIQVTTQHFLIFTFVFRSIYEYEFVYLRSEQRQIYQGFRGEIEEVRGHNKCVRRDDGCAF